MVLGSAEHSHLIPCAGLASGRVAGNLVRGTPDLVGVGTNVSHLKSWWTGRWADSISGLLRNSAWKEKVGRTHKLPSPEEGLLEGRFQAGENGDSMEMQGNGSYAGPGGVGT